MEFQTKERFFVITMKNRFFLAITRLKSTFRLNNDFSRSLKKSTFQRKRVNFEITLKKLFFSHNSLSVNILKKYIFKKFVFFWS